MRSEILALILPEVQEYLKFVEALINIWMLKEIKLQILWWLVVPTISCCAKKLLGVYYYRSFSFSLSLIVA
jgi:hypothetical protein